MDDEKWKRLIEHRQTELEKWRGEIDIWRDNQEWERSKYQTVNAAGQGTLKCALLINSGAAVAMLAFIGSSISEPTSKVLLGKLSFSLLLFIAGTFCTALAASFTYMAVFFDGMDDKKKPRIIKWLLSFRLFNSLSWLLVAACYVFFVCGSLNAYYAFTNSLS